MSYASQLGTFSVTVKKRFSSLTIPILICSILSGICSFVIFGYFFTDFGGGQGPPPAIPPFGGGLFENATYVALFYVGIALIGATIIFLIFKYGKIKLLRALFAVAIALTSFFFVFMLIYTTPYYLLDLLTEYTAFRPSTEWLILSLGIIFSTFFSVLTVVSMVYRLTPQPIPQIMALLFAVLAGTFLATFLPTLAAVFVMIGLSIYDIISVFKGPIRKIAELSEERSQTATNASKENESVKKEELKNNSVEEQTPSEEKVKQIDNRTIEPETILIDYIELGLGDLAFFGMLFSFALIKLGFFSAIGAFVGVIIGASITIKLLEKAKMMPGLPISVGLGLIFAFGVWGILTLSGYHNWGWVYPNWFG